MKNEKKLKIILFAEKILRDLKLRYMTNPQLAGEISHDKIKNILENDSKYAPIILDNNYIIITKESLENFLEFNTISEEIYKKDENDCDDFAFKTWLAIREWAPLSSVGVVIGKNQYDKMHAWNIIFVKDVDGNIELVSLEPQSDMLSDFSDKKIYRVII